jgi:hypothetical protein
LLDRRKPARSWAFFFLLLFTFAACGGGGALSPPTGPATISGTLAYVVSECREDARDWNVHQELRIQHGEGAPVTVKRLDFEGLPAVGLCSLFGLLRQGQDSLVALGFQRMGVSPDGSMVVFEVTDDFSLLHQPEFGGVGSLVPAEEKGIFLVHADRSGLRRLGDASREPSFRVAPEADAPGGLGGSTGGGYLTFSPDGRRIDFIDLGPGPTGEDAAQLFVQDVITGERSQLTSLPALAAISPYDPTVFPGFFLDDETIQFFTYALTDVSAYTVNVNAPGTLTRREPIPIPGATFSPSFSITSAATDVFGVTFFGRTPVNPLLRFKTQVTELFVEGDENLLQLTNFNRLDTGATLLGVGGLVTPDRQRVVFEASADPFGTNPDENCQIFSIDTLGADLRQLTTFGEGAHAEAGCFYPYPRGAGCLIYFVGLDRRSDSLLFYSSCNPKGTNPNGGQFFAMHFDGTGLRQLSAFRGMTTAADGTVTVELPGPFAYSRP